MYLALCVRLHSRVRPRASWTAELHAALHACLYVSLYVRVYTLRESVAACALLEFLLSSLDGEQKFSLLAVCFLCFFLVSRCSPSLLVFLTKQTDEEMKSIEYLQNQSGSSNALSFYDTRKVNGTGHWRLQQDLAVIHHRVNATSQPSYSPSSSLPHPSSSSSAASAASSTKEKKTQTTGK